MFAGIKDRETFESFTSSGKIPDLALQYVIQTVSLPLFWKENK